MGIGKGRNKVLYKEALARGQNPILHSVHDRKGYPFI